MPDASGSPPRSKCKRQRQLSVVWAVLAILALAGCATRSPTTSSAARFPFEKFGAPARVIYIAEKHNEPSHHELQEKIIRSLHRDGQAVTVGMEMIDVTQQRALDEYLKNKISWSTFARSTGFESGWGKTSPAYQRILEWCRRNEVPVIGLNAPSSITRKLAHGTKLTPAEAALVPNFPAPPGGFRKFQAAMAHHPGSGSPRRYYQAQRAWDATMAARILSWLRNHHGTLIVLLGQIHADPQTGVPWYVARNSGVAQVIIYSRK
jgi:uncharacterized iron-regulated protein